MDVGNSCLKWAFLTQNGLSQQQSLLYQQETITQGFEQVAKSFQSLLGIQPSAPEAVWVANVAGAKTEAVLNQWIKTRWAIEPTFVRTTKEAAGVVNSYQAPERLGVDRWLALIGAHHLFKGKLCIVDCGTAITLDVLAATGQHEGGVIMPGFRLMRHALMTKTHGLAQLAEEEPSLNKKTALFAQDTQAAVHLGTLYAVVGGLEYIFSQLDAQKEPFTLLLTGGSAMILLPLLHRSYHYVPELVLQGLVFLANNS